MQYKPLAKIYYENRAHYEEIYRSYFDSPAAVHFDFEINGNPAFYVNVADMTEILYLIGKTGEALTRMIEDLPEGATRRYAYHKMTDEINLTNQIEGVRSSKKEIDNILRTEDRSAGKKRFYGLVKKYEKLMTNEPVALETCADIRAIYDEIVSDEVISADSNNAPDGIFFRKNAVCVYNVRGEAIHRGLTPEQAIVDTMSKCLNMLKNQKYNAIVTIAVFHYMFGYIHPFYDGNGRINRFISSALLSKEIVPLVGFDISEKIVRDKSAYERAFEETNDTKNKGDLTSFILYFLQVIRTSLKSLLENLIEKYKTEAHYIQVLQNFRFTGKQKKTLDALLENSIFGYRGLSVAEISQTANFNEDGVRKFIKGFRNFIKQERDGRELLYTVNLAKLDENVSVK